MGVAGFLIFLRCVDDFFMYVFVLNMFWVSDVHGEFVLQA